MNNNYLDKTNFFILTGGPGAGKTIVLMQLKQLGYTTVPEVARDIIKNQEKIKGQATHRGDRNAFRDLMLEQSIRDFKQLQSSSSPVFFDRGIPDLEGYTQGFCTTINPDLAQAITHYRYNPKVFIFPPWPAIYKQDEERKQDFQEAIQTYEAIEKAYQTCGYSLIEMPKKTPSARVEFILKHV